MSGNRTSREPGTVLPERHPDAPAPGHRIESHYSRCVGCGHDHPTGLRVAVTAGQGLTATGQFTVTEDHQGAPGLAHGGMLSLAFDEVLGSLIWLIGMPAVTGHLEIDFRRPVPVGTSLDIQAGIDGMAGRKLFMSATGRANAPDGPVSVSASSVFIVVSGSHFAEHGRVQEVETARQNDDVRRAARAVEVNP